MNRIKKGIFKALNFCGYHINYKAYKIRPNGIITSRKKVKKPLYVEFLGIRAVGKSTVLLKLMESHNRYVDYELFAKHYPSLPRVLKKGVLENPFYQNIVRDQIEKLMDDDNVLPTDKAFLIGTYFDKMHSDLQLRMYNKNYIVLTDEGIFKHFYKSIYELYNNKEGEDILKEQCRDRMYIHCYNSPEKIVEQIQERGRTKALNIVYKNKSYDELIEICEEGYEDERKMINLLKKIGVPVLEINTSEAIQKNADQVDEFILRYQQEK